MKKEHSKERSRIQHRNLLLPFMGMPLCKNTNSFYKQTSSNSPSDPGHTVNDTSSSHPISNDSCVPHPHSCTFLDALSSSLQASNVNISISQSNTSSTSVHDKQVIPASADDTIPKHVHSDSPSPAPTSFIGSKYVIPALRGKCYDGDRRRPTRIRKKPSWMLSDNWRLN